VNSEPPLFCRLYLDEDVHRRVAAALRLRHFDVVSAHEVQRWGLTDNEQLSYAASEGRALFTSILQTTCDSTWTGYGEANSTMALSSPNNYRSAKRCDGSWGC
jgi:hypothetical protein